MWSVPRKKSTILLLLTAYDNELNALLFHTILPVNKVEPSGLHFPTVTFPSWASMVLSTFVVLLIKCNLPVIENENYLLTTYQIYCCDFFMNIKITVPLDEVIRICSVPEILFVDRWALINICKSTGYDWSGKSHNLIISFVAWLHFDSVKSLLSISLNNLNYKL